MATTVTHVIDPDSGAGYDYDSLFDWEAGEQGDLTGVRDEIAAADCRCTAGTADTTGFTIAGWTTSATQYINIYGGTSYRHAGVWDDTKSRMSTGSSTAINILASWTRISYLQFTVTGGCDTITCSTGAVTDVRIFNNISRCVSSTGSEFIYENNTNSSGWKIYNNIIYDHANSGIRLSSGSSMVAYNNTISGCGVGILNNIENGVIGINNILNGCTTGATGTFAAGTDYNATDDAAIGYAVTGGGNIHDHVSHIFTFVGATDFHLAAADVGAKDLGVANPGSGLFLDDIDGVTRSGTWDIGADEYVAAGEIRNLLAAIAGASLTPGIGSTSTRAILSAIGGISSTPAISATTVRLLLSALTGASLTPVASASLSRALLANLQAASSTPQANAALARALAALISGASATPGIGATTIRALPAQISGQSLTSSAAAAMSRALLAAVSGQSLTPEISAQLVHFLIASIQGASATPGITQTINRALSAAIAGGSLTPEISLTIVRALAAAIIGSSVTPNISITLQGIISLIAAIAGASVTPGISATSVRSLGAIIYGASVSPDILASVARSLLATLSGESSTPDVAIQNILNLAAAITGVSLSPAISLQMARTLSALCAGQSVTPEIQAAVARMLLADIRGSSITPDDLILIMGALGVIIDPSIEIISSLRGLESISSEREAVSITARRTIHNV